MSRDTFLQMCKDGRFTATEKPSNSTAGRDIGRGDLTGGPPLSKGDALEKLAALDYRYIQDLSLDGKGIWRGTAVVNGNPTKVAIDPQGDVISEVPEAADKRTRRQRRRR